MAKLEPEIVQKIIERYRQGASTREIGQELKLHHSTVAKYVNKYGARTGQGDTHGQPPPPELQVDKVLDKTDIDGSTEVIKLDRPATVEEMREWCQLDPKVWIPQYYKGNTWQGFYKVRDGDTHRKVQLIQSKIVWKRIVTEQLEDAIVEFIRWKTPKSRKGPTRKKQAKQKKRQMLVWGLWDAHIGMYAWQPEVGADFDVDIICNRIFNSVDDIVEELRPYDIEEIVMPLGNDFLHFDSVRMTTTLGDHFLDTDTRYSHVYLSGLKCLSYMVERGLEIADRIRIPYVPGNHDYTSSFGLCVAIDQRYRDDDRIAVDLSPNTRKYVKYGGTLVGFHHGKDTKPNQFPLIFGQECKEHWSESTYREVQIGHTHQRRERNYAGVVPTNNLLVRTNSTLCNTDYWHHSKGLLGEPTRSVEAWRYDKIGYRGSHVAWARDEDNPEIKKFLV